MDDYAKTFTKECIDTLLEIARSEHEDAAVRIAAYKEILHRGWGSSSEAVVIRINDTED
jgi:hypothetical protein